MLWSIVQERWEFFVMCVCYAYLWLAFLDILLAGNRNDLDLPMEDFIREHRDIAAAIATIMVLLPPFFVNVCVMYTRELVLE